MKIYFSNYQYILSVFGKVRIYQFLILDTYKIYVEFFGYETKKHTRLDVLNKIIY